MAPSEPAHRGKQVIVDFEKNRLAGCRQASTESAHFRLHLARCEPGKTPKD